MNAGTAAPWIGGHTRKKKTKQANDVIASSDNVKPSLW